MVRKNSVRRVFSHTRQEHIKTRKAILDSGETIMQGSTSGAFYVPAIRTKYIPIWQTYEWHGERLLAGEIARLELNKKFVDLKKVGNWRGSQIKLLNYRWPMFFQEKYFGEAVYFDLVGAYWQFYKNLWLDVGYPCGYGSLDLAPVSEKLKDHKTARNALVGLTRSTKVSLQKKGSRWQVPTKNKFLSPPLWANLMGWLQEIATEALGRGAIYVMMDGFFFPQDSNHKGFQSFLNHFGLEYRKKTGFCEIIGWGAYRADWGAETSLFAKKAGGKVNSVGRHFLEPYKFLSWWQGSIDYRFWRFTKCKK